jgi:hypothetical protein
MLESKCLGQLKGCFSQGRKITSVANKSNMKKAQPCIPHTQIYGIEFQTINVQSFLYNYNITYYHPPRKTTYLKYYGIALSKERLNITIYPN